MLLLSRLINCECSLCRSQSLSQITENSMLHGLQQLHAWFIVKYYADFVGSSRDMFFTEHSENDQTFPNLFLPLLEVNKVKIIKVTSVSSKYLGASAFAANLYWNHCIENPFFQ